MQILYEYIKQFAVLTKQEFEQIASLLEVKHCKKNQTITPKGSIENYLYIITNGLVRKFFYKKNYEMVTQIAKEGDMVCSSVSFFSQTPSEYVVESLEPSTLYSLSYDNLQKMYSWGYKMERLGRLVILDSLLQKEVWELERIKAEPRERFKKFMNDNKDLIQRVPQKYLASYLNMKPETFSRYKHLLKH
jgi:signal-transduction protein with cAMP-binding, CBS, and nucleotidyltransferase domain